MMRDKGRGGGDPILRHDEGQGEGRGGGNPTLRHDDQAVCYHLRVHHAFQEGVVQDYGEHLKQQRGPHRQDR